MKDLHDNQSWTTFPWQQKWVKMVTFQCVWGFSFSTVTNSPNVSVSERSRNYLKRTAVKFVWIHSGEAGLKFRACERSVTMFVPSFQVTFKKKIKFCTPLLYRPQTTLVTSSLKRQEVNGTIHCCCFVFLRFWLASVASYISFWMRLLLCKLIF